MSTQLLDEEFLTEEETGEILGVCVTTLRIQSARRQGPPRVKVGRRAYYRKKSLLEWMLDRERFHSNKKGFEELPPKRPVIRVKAGSRTVGEN